MKHLKTCIAVSLDGFIATKDNELDWMPENVSKEIAAAYEQSGVLLAGVNTYSYIFPLRNRIWNTVYAPFLWV